MAIGKPFNPNEIFIALEGELAEDIGETAFAILRNLVIRSPVGNPTLWQNPDGAAPGYVGGHFRRNWLISVRAADSSTTEGAGASAAVPLAEGRAKIIAAKASRALRIIIQNNVPYANRLALGHSTQAAFGWIDESINAALGTPGGVRDLR